MKYSDLKLNDILISPCGGKWKIIKKYARDMWLIKLNNKVGILMSGEFRKGWRKEADCSAP